MNMIYYNICLYIRMWIWIWCTINICIYIYICFYFGWSCVFYLSPYFFLTYFLCSYWPFSKYLSFIDMWFCQQLCNFPSETLTFLSYLLSQAQLVLLHCGFIFFDHYPYSWHITHSFSPWSVCVCVLDDSLWNNTVQVIKSTNHHSAIDKPCVLSLQSSLSHESSL